MARKKWKYFIACLIMILLLPVMPVIMVIRRAVEVIGDAILNLIDSLEMWMYR